MTLNIHGELMGFRGGKTRTKPVEIVVCPPRRPEFGQKFHKIPQNTKNLTALWYNGKRGIWFNFGMFRGDGAFKCNFRDRHYHPDTGTFLSEDPIGFGGGDANLYRYVRNNPLK